MTTEQAQRSSEPKTLQPQESTTPALAGPAITTGFRDVDACLETGLPRGSLVVIGARPSMGKTSLTLGFARNIASDQARNVLVFSNESSKSVISHRLLCAEAEVDSGKALAGTLSEEDLQKVTTAANKLGELPFWSDCSYPQSVEYIRDKSLEFAANRSIGLIVVDNIQLLDDLSPTPTRAAAVSHSAVVLKQLAQSVHAPVLVVAHLPREVEERVNKRPLLSDLWNAGSLKDNADVVLFLYRHDFYVGDSPDVGVAEISIEKPSLGKRRVARLAWIPEQHRFATIG